MSHRGPGQHFRPLTGGPLITPQGQTGPGWSDPRTTLGPGNEPARYHLQVRGRGAAMHSRAKAPGFMPDRVIDEHQGSPGVWLQRVSSL